MFFSKSLSNARFLPDDYSSKHDIKSGFKGSISLYGKQVQVTVSPSAIKALDNSQTIITAEMELYFSCLIRKRVLFNTGDQNQTTSDSTTQLLPGLLVSFNPVTTKACSVAESPDEPLKEAMPIKEPGLFVPDWLDINYRSSQWRGEYGFVSRT